MTSIVSVEETPDASRMSDKKPDSGSDKPTGMVRNLTPSKVGGVTQKRRYFKTPEALKTPSYHELKKASQKKTLLQKVLGSNFVCSCLSLSPQKSTQTKI